ncbi:MAG TPA: sigma-54 dependent transcriptional regulator [Methylomirabilota bacterium]|jgi:two-component system, NtrC family, response regulator AtoC|nr:sigma-54 dependent transcriptional regulator [Methylomirabilota bacterium]
MDHPRVLVVDDDADVGGLLREALSRWGYDVTLATSGREAVRLISHQIFDAALVDIWMPEMDGLQVLEEIKRHDPALEVVMMTGDPMVETAVQALKSGAYDYLIKPLNLDEMQVLMQQVLEKRFLSREVHSLRSRLADHLAVKDLVGSSLGMTRVKEVIATIADSDSPVLIEGESGTGKELVAAAIHRQSQRSKGPFVPVNCSAIPADLMESEFFGHVRGAFSGAVADALGLFRSAHGGTLFLDEIAELSPALQAKLLRVLQEKEIRPVGSTKTHAVSVRMIAATNKILENVVQGGSFRQDLFYRLNVVRIVVPPLRERKDDIPALITYFIRRFNERFRRDVKGIAPDAIAALTAYDFPGNVRELENLLERAYALGARDEIERASFPELAARSDAPVVTVDEPIPTIDQAERDLIARALTRFKNDKDQAARALGLTVRTLYRRIKKFGLV